MIPRLVRRLPLPRRLSAPRAYFIAVFATGLALGLRLLLLPLLQYRYPLSLFLLAAWLATWFCGTGPGFLSLVLGYFLGDFFFVPPIFSVAPGGPAEVVNLTVYIFTGFFGLFIMTALRHSLEMWEVSERHSFELEREVRERKAAEESASRAKDDLASLNSNLELLVEARTRALLQTTEDLNSFCFSVAHDLKAPLRAQASFAQLLLARYSGPLGDSGGLMLQRIIDSAEKQSRLVDDLLAHLSVSRGEQQLAPCDLQAAITDTVAELEPQIRAQNAVIHYDGVAHCSVLANAASLALVLQNLLTNAFKFVAPGVRPRVALWTEQRNSLIRLWVRDNGIGIAPEFHQQIWGVFQRLHQERRYPGTGIGLAIVKRAVERMQGAVGLDSEPGKGSTFWIELPLSQGSAAAGPQWHHA